MEGSVDAQCASLMDEELNNLIGDYSIPHVAELGQDSVLAHSQYAKVRYYVKHCLITVSTQTSLNVWI
jgi:hypothetical protein